MGVVKTFQQSISKEKTLNCSANFLSNDVPKCMIEFGSEVVLTQCSQRINRKRGSLHFLVCNWFCKVSIHSVGYFLLKPSSKFAEFDGLQVEKRSSKYLTASAPIHLPPSLDSSRHILFNLLHALVLAWKNIVF